MLETNAWSLGQGAPNPLSPPPSRNGPSRSTSSAAEGRKLYEPDTAAAKKLLAEAGHPNGIKTTIETTPGYGPDWMDAVQVPLKNLKSAGIEADLKLKEYGAFISTTLLGKFEKAIITRRAAPPTPTRTSRRSCPASR